MDTTDVDGPSNISSNKLINSVILSELTVFPQSSEEVLSLDNQSMPPRTNTEYGPMPSSVKKEVDEDDDQMSGQQHASASAIQKARAVSSQQLPLMEAVQFPKQDSNACKWTDDTNLFHRRSACKDRLKVCSDRLKKVHTRATALFSRLLIINLAHLDSHQPCPPAIISRALADEDTESSTDEDEAVGPLSSPSTTNNKPTMSDLSHQWFYTRALLNSQWHWLRTEVKQSRNTLKNLRLARASYQKWKYCTTRPIVQTGGSEQCARLLPYTNSSHPTVHNLAQLKRANSMSKLSSLTDPYVQCSCTTTSNDSCIICCGSNGSATSSRHAAPSGTLDMDVLQHAASLMGHMHPKLSVVGDVPLNLRLESHTFTYPAVMDSSTRERHGAPTAAAAASCDTRPLARRQHSNCTTTASPSVAESSLREDPSDCDMSTTAAAASTYPSSSSSRTSWTSNLNRLSPPPPPRRPLGRSTYSPSIVQRVFQSSSATHSYPSGHRKDSRSTAMKRNR